MNLSSCKNLYRTVIITNSDLSIPKSRLAITSIAAYALFLLILLDLLPYDGGTYQTETGLLTCTINQLNGFYTPGLFSISKICRMGS